MGVDRVDRGLGGAKSAKRRDHGERGQMAGGESCARWRPEGAPVSRSREQTSSLRKDCETDESSRVLRGNKWARLGSPLGADPPPMRGLDAAAALESPSPWWLRSSAALPHSVLRCAAPLVGRIGMINDMRACSYQDQVPDRRVLL